LGISIKVFKIDQIVEASRLVEESEAGVKLVVLVNTAVPPIASKGNYL
jgi:hypothetical protein